MKRKNMMKKTIKTLIIAGVLIQGGAVKGQDLSQSQSFENLPAVIKLTSAVGTSYTVNSPCTDINGLLQGGKEKVCTFKSVKDISLKASNNYPAEGDVGRQVY